MLQIHAEPELRSLTSLHLGGKALACVTIHSIEDLDSLPETLKKLGGRPVMLGGGTNILAADGLLPLVLVRCAFESAPQVMGEDGNGNLLVRVSANMKLSRLLGWCFQTGLGGLEGMVGIPGTVGGAVAGNAGAQGTDIGSHVGRVNVFSPGMGYKKMIWCDMQFGYRSLKIPECAGAFQVFTGVVLSLQPTPRSSIQQKTRECMAHKLAAQPLRVWSAGCVFKNPVSPDAKNESLSAGKLLDTAGFRGKRLGGMCFSPLHANFLVNEGSGSSGAAFDLIHEAQEAVH
ncbi:MAG: FAD-binding protein, partial [Bilophila sp.]